MSLEPSLLLGDDEAQLARLQSRVDVSQAHSLHLGLCLDSERTEGAMLWKQCQREALGSLDLAPSSGDSPNVR